MLLLFNPSAAFLHLHHLEEAQGDHLPAAHHTGEIVRKVTIINILLTALEEDDMAADRLNLMGMVALQVLLDHDMDVICHPHGISSVQDHHPQVEDTVLEDNRRIGIAGVVQLEVEVHLPDDIRTGQGQEAGVTIVDLADLSADHHRLLPEEELVEVEEVMEDEIIHRHQGVAQEELEVGDVEVQVSIVTVITAREVEEVGGAGVEVGITEAHEEDNPACMASLFRYRNTS